MADRPRRPAERVCGRDRRPPLLRRRPAPRGQRGHPAARGNLRRDPQSPGGRGRGPTGRSPDRPGCHGGPDPAVRGREHPPRRAALERTVWRRGAPSSSRARHAAVRPARRRRASPAQGGGPERHGLGLPHLSAGGPRHARTAGRDVGLVRRRSACPSRRASESCRGPVWLDREIRAHLLVIGTRTSGDVPRDTLPLFAREMLTVLAADDDDTDRWDDWRGRIEIVD